MYTHDYTCTYIFIVAHAGRVALAEIFEKRTYGKLKEIEQTLCVQRLCEFRSISVMVHSIIFDFQFP